MPKLDPYKDYDPNEYRLAINDYKRYMEEQDDSDGVDPDNDNEVRERFNERLRENCSWDEYRWRKFFGN